eukprot:GHVO01034118.1.p1 GENE.GHVO01034118.1~~GHVO01034118.1.p1  ORF type:complete len:496 (-),score=74.80 GHVO01034118.1:233-1720(-)
MISTPNNVDSCFTQKHKAHFACVMELAEYIASGAIDQVDICFIDPLGVWHHCTFACSQCDEKALTEGFAFDGSSITLFKAIDKSDMLMIPDHTTAWMDPFCTRPTLHLTANVYEANGDVYERCPRQIARRAEQFLQESGIADIAYMGPEPEFFIFDNVQYAVGSNKVSYEVCGDEASWNTNAQSSYSRPKEHRNLGHRMVSNRNYAPVPPVDHLMNVRTEILMVMGEIGIPIEKHHHEVATMQCEIGFSCRGVCETADLLMDSKYVVKNVAQRNGKTVTFMPKPVHGENGSGMHCHQSLWKNGQNIFHDEKGEFMKLSATALHYIAGILAHGPALCAITNPITNSYKRLVPGYEAPVNLVFDSGNRAAAVRIPSYHCDVAKAKRMEFRCPDAACNPYLAFSAMLLAGIDGIKRKLVPPKPISQQTAEEIANTVSNKIPRNLDEAMDALEKDHEFLTMTGVFSADFIKDYIAEKRTEGMEISMVPHPKELQMYYHV